MITAIDLQTIRKKSQWRLMMILIILWWPLCSTAAPHPITVTGYAFTAQQLKLTLQLPQDYLLYQNTTRIYQKNGPRKIRLTPLYFPQSTQTRISPSGSNTPIFSNPVTIGIPLEKITFKKTAVKLLIHGQGCNSNGICYPPFQLDTTVTAPAPSHQTHKLSFFKHSLSFLLLGLLLAASPCVWPMFPVLFAVIINRNEQRLNRYNFLLCVAYTLSLSITYAGIGYLSVLFGAHLMQLQHSAFTTTVFCLVLLFFAAYLFDLLPTALIPNIAYTPHHTPKGRIAFAVLAGAFAPLALSPCVTPAMVSAMLYISQYHQPIAGAIALFFTGIGMCLPLIVVGILGTHWLPNSGPWLLVIKKITGIVIILLALDMIRAQLPATITLILQLGVWILCSYTVMRLPTKKNSYRIFKYSIGMLVFVCGGILLAKTRLGDTTPWYPLNGHNKNKPPSLRQLMPPITSPAELEHCRQRAQQLKKPLFVYFHAQWCSTCKHLEAALFSDPSIKVLFSRALGRSVDITTLSAQKKMLIEQLQIIGPPTIVWWDLHGKRQPALRLVGHFSSAAILNRLARLSMTRP